MADQQDSPIEPPAESARASRKTTPWGRLLAHDDIAVWAVGVALVGVVAFWIFR